MEQQIINTIESWEAIHDMWMFVRDSADGDKIIENKGKNGMLRARNKIDFWSNELHKLRHG